ncbi:hypothetical protein ACFWP3_20470 [Streptomyces sp. NPDC058525]|uniref:hypothetical protein n=1 Tax=Streptomyces sp. NPDC058525 TaxID=3346538 RepID=UPI00364A5AF2
MAPRYDLPGAAPGPAPDGSGLPARALGLDDLPYGAVDVRPGLDPLGEPGKLPGDGAQQPQLQRRHVDLAPVAADGSYDAVAQVAGGNAFDSRHIAPFELYVQAGRDERLRAAAAECFAAYDLLATRILTQLGVPDPERLAGAAVALVFGQQLRRLATGAPAEDLVDALLVLTKLAPTHTP